MYTNAKYVVEEPGVEPVQILLSINGRESTVPLDITNRHYQEIMDLVEAGELTIEPAD